MGTGHEDANLSTPISVAQLSSALSDVIEEYGNDVYTATEEGLDQAEKILIRRLSDASPVDSGVFKRSWRGTKRKYKLVRYVGNTKTVRTKGRNVPLTNIFEYSTSNHRKPFMKQTFENCADELARAIVGTLEDNL